MRGDTEIVLIAAVATNGVIGVDDELPWHYPKDLEFFRSQTVGKPVVMGRVTFESIIEQSGGVLEDRLTIVLTRNPDEITVEEPLTETTGMDALLDTTRVVTASRLEEAVGIAGVEDANELYVAGGASVYEQFLPVSDTLLLTEIHDSYEGDTTFPEWNEENWVVESRDKHDEFTFVKRTRVDTTSVLGN